MLGLARRTRHRLGTTTRTPIGSLLALAVGASAWLTFAVPSPAAADAKAGDCAPGYQLESHRQSHTAHNAMGQLMWTITWKKRWCYHKTKQRIGSVYAPQPAVKIYGVFSAAWISQGVVDKDSYYTAKDATGRRHPGRPRWGHVSWHTVRLDHCAIKYALCWPRYYKVGTTSYWDGAKKVMLP